MTSNINQYNINGNFPVAGQDNDSQGFRDNFTNIKTNLGYAKSEIEDLQSKAILKTALTGGSLDNDFNGSVIHNVVTKDLRSTIATLSIDAGNLTTVNVASAPVHLLTTTGHASLTLGITGWPSDSTHATFRLRVIAGETVQVIALPAAVTDGVKNIVGLNTDTNILTLAGSPVTPQVYWFEFSSIDGGTTITIRDLTRPVATQYNTFGTPASNKGAIGDAQGMVKFDASYAYYCVANYDGSSVIWKRVALSSY